MATIDPVNKELYIINSLPTEILNQILDDKSFFSIARVSKSWFHTINTMCTEKLNERCIKILTDLSPIVQWGNHIVKYCKVMEGMWIDDITLKQKPTLCNGRNYFAMLENIKDILKNNVPAYNKTAANLLINFNKLKGKINPRNGQSQFEKRDQALLESKLQMLMESQVQFPAPSLVVNTSNLDLYSFNAIVQAANRGLQYQVVNDVISDLISGKAEEQTILQAIKTQINHPVQCEHVLKAIQNEYFSGELIPSLLNNLNLVNKEDPSYNSQQKCLHKALNAALRCPISEPVLIKLIEKMDNVEASFLSQVIHLCSENVLMGLINKCKEADYKIARELIKYVYVNVFESKRYSFTPLIQMIGTFNNTKIEDCLKKPLQDKWAERVILSLVKLEASFKPDLLELAMSQSYSEKVILPMIDRLSPIHLARYDFIDSAINHGYLSKPVVIQQLVKKGQVVGNEHISLVLEGNSNEAEINLVLDLFDKSIISEASRHLFTCLNYSKSDGVIDKILDKAVEIEKECVNMAIHLGRSQDLIDKMKSKCSAFGGCAVM